MTKLTPEELTQALDTLPNWAIAPEGLIRTFSFPDFVAAMQFVNHAAQLAEAAGHHPDIDIRYNKVKIALITHDAGGITADDTDMAARLGEATS